MSLTHVLDGKALAQTWLADIRARVQAFARPLRLVIVQVGDVHASSVYVAKKIIAAAEVGIQAERMTLSAREGETALLSLLHGLAHDEGTDAILVQTPLPEGWDVQRALDAVPWRKDVDGLSTESAERRMQGLPCHSPATPAAVLRVLRDEWHLDLKALSVAVIGNGRVVGAPLRQMLTQGGAEVLPIMRDTPHPQEVCRRAKVVVAACGVPDLVDHHWLSKGAYVVDVGLTPEELPTGRRILRGDICAPKIEGIALHRTPAPGGIGPLTVAQLLANVANVEALPLS